MAKELKINLGSEFDLDTQRFFNLLDERNWANFMKLVQDVDEKRTIEELLEAFLEGNI